MPSTLTPSKPGKPLPKNLEMAPSVLDVPEGNVFEKITSETSGCVCQVYRYHVQTFHHKNGRHFNKEKTNLLMEIELPLAVCLYRFFAFTDLQVLNGSSGNTLYHVAVC